jgi:hypothetical protein
MHNDMSKLAPPANAADAEKSARRFAIKARMITSGEAVEQGFLSQDTTTSARLREKEFYSSTGGLATEPLFRCPRSKYHASKRENIEGAAGMRLIFMQQGQAEQRAEGHHHG